MPTHPHNNKKPHIFHAFVQGDNANFIGVDFQPCTMLCLTEDIYNALTIIAVCSDQKIIRYHYVWHDVESDHS